MRFLAPTSAPMALAWMTAIEQYLGPIRRDDGWRIRWVRLDPLAAPHGILAAAYEEELACDPSALDLADRPELDPGAPLPPGYIVDSEIDAHGVSSGGIEVAALLRAEREMGAHRDRWVNSAVEGWRELCHLRGHE
ncbi:MAG TPA: hypothetical protein VFY84_12580 [Jiangellales bacterium]|nr:hypothetical protein [Jiangellales bacterium]